MSIKEKGNMGSIRTLPANLKPVDLEVSPSLTIQGTTTPVNIHNFLGLKYASISARFRQAIPTAPLSQQTGIIDATAYGPRCSQWVLPELDAVRDGFGRFQPPSSLPDSDLDCCVVNVYVPPGILKSPSEGQIDLLPVLVWIHGGALSLGDGNSMAGTKRVLVTILAEIILTISNSFPSCRRQFTRPTCR
jgi:carboxylesterase type B